MDIKQIIKRARQQKLSAKQIAYILDLDLDTVQQIVERNGWSTIYRPGCMPDSYFIEKLSNQVPVADIANELECTRASIYRLLERRGISFDAYR